MKKLLAAINNWIEKRSKEPWGLVALLLISLLHSVIDIGLTRVTLNQAGVSPETAQGSAAAVPPLSILLAGIAILTWALDWDRLLRWAILIFNGLVTLDVSLSIIGLVITLPLREGQFGQTSLLRDAVLVWISNVLVFTVWYWMLDCGGPEKRKRGRPDRADFSFAQQRHTFAGWETWKPTFVDYLFLAFIMSTNFSVPDVEVLSRRAKWLMMIQVANALLTLAMVVARAISIIR